MSENETDQYNDDEYHFIDEIEDEVSENEASEDASSENVSSNPPLNESHKPKIEMNNFIDFFKHSSPVRNAVIVIAIGITLYFLYHFTSSLITNGKHEKVQDKAVSSPQAIPALTVTTSAAPQISQKIAAMETNVKEKLSSVEQSQASMQTQITSMNNQISSLSSNLSIITEKMTQLNQQIAQLATKVQDQSNFIVALNERTKPKHKLIKRVKTNNPSAVIYYMQAVIPGRAWLVANNGSTITVREGTPIPGYGIVKIIDPIQGRVLTSSGQVIKFSQEDS